MLASFSESTKLRGVFTALITPFNADESIDYEAFGKIIEDQINAGVAGTVVCGTTGESPTISHEEHREVLAFAIEKVDKRCLVIAGTGSNSTKEAIGLTKYAEHAGADACLVVNPYYNKPTQEGLFRHFKAVADSVNVPIIVYNIKGRTGVNVETQTLMRIVSECKNVTCVKEASGDLNQMKDVIAVCPKGFSVLSGDDGLTIDLIKMGGKGVISVVSNLVPKKVVDFVGFALGGEMQKAENANKELAPLFSTAFIETNPIPIKAMMVLAGYCKEVYRLPMCELRPENKKKVLELMQQMKLI